MPNVSSTTESSSEVSHRERTIFVSGLDYSTSEETIGQFFSTCGGIELLKVPKYKGTKKNTGYCHVTFFTKESWQNAMNLNGSYLDHRYLDIQPVKGPQN